MLMRGDMRGYITEKDFEACEQEFPGIVSFYRALTVKPRTFLELVYVFERRSNTVSVTAIFTRAT
jgi:hypothetical protein